MVTHHHSIMPEIPVDGKKTVPKATSSPVPMSVEWKAIVEKLLKSKKYDQAAMQDDGISIENLPKDDLLFLLATMPFEFRLPALALYRAGFRIFGKIPFRQGSISPDGKLIAPPIATGEPRPVSCPEPLVHTERFAIAWKAGERWNWHLPAPKNGEAHPDDEDPVDISHYKQILEIRNPHNEERDSESEKEFLEDFFQNTISIVWDLRDSMPGKRLLQTYDLDDLDDLLHSVQNHSHPNPEKSHLAFYAGFISAIEIYYPRCIELHGKDEIASIGGWTSIIYHALKRHGIDTSRKELLKRLGCLNSDAYSKNSSEILKFKWAYAPELTGSKFDDSFKRACRDLKTSQPLKSSKDIDKHEREMAAKREKKREQRRIRKETIATNAKLVEDAKNKRSTDELKRKFM